MLTRFHILRQGACDLGIWIQRSWLFLTTNIQLNSTLKREQRHKWMRYTVRLKAWRAKCFIVRRKVKPWALISAASDAVLGRALQLNVILIFSFLRHTCIYIYVYKRIRHMMLQTDRFHVSLMSRDNCYFDFDWQVKSVWHRGSQLGRYWNSIHVWISYSVCCIRLVD